MGKKPHLLIIITEKDSETQFLRNKMINFIINLTNIEMLPAYDTYETVLYLLICAL